MCCCCALVQECREVELRSSALGMIYCCSFRSIYLFNGWLTKKKKPPPTYRRLAPNKYIYREWGYGTSQSTKPPVLRVRISNLKVQMSDLNRWTSSSYWNILGDQILCFFFLIFCYFLNGYKVCWSNDFYTIQN
jgi:hypothetical protein